MLIEAHKKYIEYYNIYVKFVLLYIFYYLFLYHYEKYQLKSENKNHLLLLSTFSF